MAAASQLLLLREYKKTLKQMGTDYWQQLIQTGIPKQEARSIAVAIAKYDINQRPPHDIQRQLICRYSAFICRANLWRGGLLLA